MTNKLIVLKRAHHMAMGWPERKLVWTVTTEKGTGKRRIWMSCAKGHWAELHADDHTIDNEGRVSPSVVCPTEGCTWHCHVQLQGYVQRVASESQEPDSPEAPTP